SRDQAFFFALPPGRRRAGRRQPWLELPSAAGMRNTPSRNDKSPAEAGLLFSQRDPAGSRTRRDGSALGELGGAAGLVQTDLLAPDFAGVAGHEAGLAQLGLQAFVVLDQGAGDAQADRTGLAGGAAAGGGDDDVEALGVLGQLERLAHDHARGLTAEELIQRTAVDGDVARTLAQEHAGG